MFWIKKELKQIDRQSYDLLERERKRDKQKRRRKCKAAEKALQKRDSPTRLDFSSRDLQLGRRSRSRNRSNAKSARSSNGGEGFGKGRCEVLASLEEAYADMLQREREEQEAAMRSSEQLIPPQRRRAPIPIPRGSAAEVLGPNTYPSVSREKPQESSMPGKLSDRTAMILGSFQRQVVKRLVELRAQKRRTGDDAVAVNKRLCTHRQFLQ